MRGELAEGVSRRRERCEEKKRLFGGFFFSTHEPLTDPREVIPARPPTRVTRRVSSPVCRAGRRQRSVTVRRDGRRGRGARGFRPARAPVRASPDLRVGFRTRQRRPRASRRQGRVPRARAVRRARVGTQPGCGRGRPTRARLRAPPRGVPRGGQVPPRARRRGRARAGFRSRRRRRGRRRRRRRRRPRRRARARGAVGRGPPREVRDACARRAPHRGRPGAPRGDARRPGDGRGARRAGSRAPRLRRRAQKVRTKPKPKLGSELGARKSGFFRKLRRGFFDARGRGSGEREGDVVEAHRSGRAQDRNPRRRRGWRRESRRGARRRRARGDARRIRDPARRHVRARAR